MNEMHGERHHRQHHNHLDDRKGGIADSMIRGGVADALLGMTTMAVSPYVSKMWISLCVMLVAESLNAKLVDAFS